MAKQQGKVGAAKSALVEALPLACADETAAVAFFEMVRWGDTPNCPRCGDTDVSQMKRRDGTRNARFLWTCRGCKKQYTVRVGTVMEDSPIPFRHWAYAWWAACSSKKGVSAKQIQRMTGLSYRSALFLMHRVRYAMAPANAQDGGKLASTVEVDETYVGGKPRYKGQYPPGRPSADRKAAVVALVERPDRLVIEGFDSWEDAVRAGLTTPPPAGGWPTAPETQPKKRRPRKTKGA